MAGPWRAVAHIEHKEGPKGGQYWGLTLECGHYVTRTIPRFMAWRFKTWTPALAPKKVRCVCCEDNPQKELAI